MFENQNILKHISEKLRWYSWNREQRSWLKGAAPNAAAEPFRSQPGWCRGEEPRVNPALKDAEAAHFLRNLGGTAVLPSHVFVG